MPAPFSQHQCLFERGVRFGVPTTCGDPPERRQSHDSPHGRLQRLLEDLSFEAPEMDGARVVIDAAYVNQRLEKLTQDEDLSKFIL